MYSCKNVGLYMKAGYCNCDIKPFVPTVVCLALVGLWFSDHKNKTGNKVAKKQRKLIISELEMLSLRMKYSLSEQFIEKYKQIA
mmetsp:Transcript_24078/g.18361  ORF Transcript_24078/g.18361 Transcript_24078/m.18361 type:complete len:84 (+) Transcript_24078:1404-1655(+)